MFNEAYVRQAQNDLIRADTQYTNVYRKAISDMEHLQTSRMMAVKVIQYIERYITALANRPRNYDTKIGEINERCIKFLDMTKELQELAQKELRSREVEKAGIAGGLFGIGTAALAPSAAMSVAMTFGTASTGTAISSLSGAAATNAALAWLGGGALTAGGAGMAAGQTILSMAGPIGWVIGGVSLAAAMVSISMSKSEMAAQTEKSINALKKETERIKEVDVQVLSWIQETKVLSNKLSGQLNKVRMFRRKDYTQFTEAELNELAVLMNAAEVLSKKIGQTIKGRK